MHFLFEQEEDDFGHLEDDLDGYMNNSTDADASTVWNIFTSNQNGELHLRSHR